MIKIETDNTEKTFKLNDLDESIVSSIGTYDQYTKVYSTNITQVTDKTFENFVIDIREDWALKEVSKDFSSEKSVISDQEINGWIGYIKEYLYTFKQVESVFYQIDKENIDIWIIIPDRNIALLRDLIDAEMNMLDRFDVEGKSLYVFEFHIIYRCGVDEINVTPQGAIRVLK